MKPSIYNMSFVELEAVCAEQAWPGYRAGQIWSWLYQKRVRDFADMASLPKAMRAGLAEAYSVGPMTVQQVAGRSPYTRKLLLALGDGERVESVVIPAPGRRTVCVSTQVGCKFGCTFCASGQAGFRRQLETAEIIGQLMAAAHELGERPTHVVFMGIGEPMDNYDAVIKAVRIMNDGKGLKIGARRITISTVGVVPGIERLAGEGLQVELSVSLHAPTDTLRGTMMPINRRWPIKTLLEACRVYTAATKRIITFEYTLVRGVNDSEKHAQETVRVLRPLHCRVNLIRLNPIDEYAEAPASNHSTTRFKDTLMAAGINTTVRDSKGRRFDGACGQLRIEEER